MSRSPVVAVAAIAVGLSLFGAACGGTDATDDAAGQAGAAQSGTVLDASVLQGQATTATGESFDLGGLADKDLVVWFWAPW